MVVVLGMGALGGVGSRELGLAALVAVLVGVPAGRRPWAPHG
ncbi:hypothetical protein [Blastococcus sp. SYSU DS0619]